MPVESFSPAQLHSLHASLEADVTVAVHDAALRGRLLQLLDERFQQLFHAQLDGAALDNGNEQRQQLNSGQSCDELPADDELTEAAHPSSGQQQQQQYERAASSTPQSTPLVTSSAKSKRKAKSRNVRAESEQSSGSLSSSRQPSQPQPQPRPSSTAQPAHPPPLLSIVAPSTTLSPSAERDVDLLPPTATSVRVEHNEQTGRLVRVAASLAAGTRLMDDRGYAAVIKLERCREVCSLCHSLIDDSHSSSTARLACSECRVAHYCSARCQRLDASYRHATDCRMLATVGRLSGSVSVDADLLQLLAAVCGRQYRERHRDKYPTCSSQTGMADDGLQTTSSHDSGDATLTEDKAEAARWRDDDLVSRTAHTHMGAERAGLR